MFKSTNFMIFNKNKYKNFDLSKSVYIHIKNLWFVFFLSLLLFNATSLSAQDIHYSQYYNSPLNLNPAKAGYFMGSHRFALNFKNQWQSVTVPYRTFTASFDMPVLHRNKQQDMFGSGIIVNTDKAGDAGYSTTQINLALSYIKALNKFNNHYISFALQPGITQKSFNQDALNFDNQFDGISYNQNLPQGEIFTKTNFLFFDISAGIYWNYQYANNLGFDAGMAVFHINKPSQTYFNDPTTILNRKLLLFGNAIFQLSEKYDLIPGLFYTKQYNFKEFIMGSTFRYIKSPNPVNYSTFNLGMFFRTKDAAIVVAGFDYLQYNFAVSYDINYSNLKAASRNLGGLELSFKYILDSKRTYIKKTPCPIF